MQQKNAFAIEIANAFFVFGFVSNPESENRKINALRNKYHKISSCDTCISSYVHTLHIELWLFLRGIIRIWI